MGGRQTIRSGGFLVGVFVAILAVVVLAACPVPLTELGSTNTSLNADAPSAPVVSTATVSGAVVSWTWSSTDNERGTGVFRWRMNGGSWRGPVTYTQLTPNPNEETAANQGAFADHPGTPGSDGIKRLNPGTYTLEVQERDTYGNWSDSQVATPVVVAGSWINTDSYLLAHFEFENLDWSDSRGNWLAYPGSDLANAPGITDGLSQPSPAGSGAADFRTWGNPHGGFVDFTKVDGSPVDLGGAFTIAMWVLAASENDGAPLVSTITISTDAEFGMFPQSGGVMFNLFDLGGGLQFIALSDPSSEPQMFGGGLPTYEPYWRHVAVTVDSASGTVELYIDGIPVAQSAYGEPNGPEMTALSTGFPTQQVPFRVGAHLVAEGFEEGNSYFDGLIDDLRVYGAALTGAQVAELAGMQVYSGELNADSEMSFFQPESYADRREFTLNQPSRVQLALISLNYNAYLAVYDSSNVAAGPIHTAPNDPGDLDSYLDVWLEPGTYIVEATTYSSGMSGAYALYSTVALSAVSPPEEFQVGGLGPAGGIVFYDKGVHSDGWRYLEAAPSGSWDIYSISWADSGQTTVSVSWTDAAVGSGFPNTDLIVNTLGINLNYAALWCFEFVLSGYDDWFLPSKDELNLLYLHKDVVGGFEPTNYWSSTENSAGTAWYQHFSTGIQAAAYDKGYGNRIRPIRRF